MSGRTTRAATLFWGTLAALLLAALFAAAGTWQLGRAAEKRELFSAFARGAGASPLAALPADADFEAARYQPLILEGRYDAARQILLDNAVAEGRVGYFVLTPFLTDRGAVLVNRGFVPAPADRSELPAVEVGAQARRIAGIADVLPRPGLRLAEPELAPDAPWPRRLLYPDSAAVAAQLGYPLRSFQLLLDADQPDGYLRRWSPATKPPEDHLGYAIQWFGLLATLLAIYFLLLWRHLRSRRT